VGSPGRKWRPNNAKRFVEISELADVLGCTRQTLTKWQRDPTFPWADANRRECIVYDVVIWKHRQDYPPASQPAVDYDADDDDILDNLPATDAVEQKERIAWIRERRLIAQQKRMEADQQLCAREVVRDLVVRWGTKVRAAAERIQRRFGADAAKPLLDAMQELDEELASEDVIGSSE